MGSSWGSSGQEPGLGSSTDQAGQVWPPFKICLSVCLPKMPCRLVGPLQPLPQRCTRVLATGVPGHGSVASLPRLFDRLEYDDGFHSAKAFI